MKHTSRLSTGIDKRVMAALPMAGVLPKSMHERFEEDYETNACTYRGLFSDLLPKYEEEDDLRGTAEVLARQMSRDLAFEDYEGILRQQQELSAAGFRLVTGIKVRQDVCRQLREVEPLGFDEFFKRPERTRFATSHGRSYRRPKGETKYMRQMHERAMYSSPFDRWRAIRGMHGEITGVDHPDLEPDQLLPIAGKVVASKYELIREGRSNAKFSVVAGVDPRMDLILYNGQRANVFSSELIGDARDIDLREHERKREQAFRARKRKRYSNKRWSR